MTENEDTPANDAAPESAEVPEVATRHVVAPNTCVGSKRGPLHSGAEIFRADVGDDAFDELLAAGHVVVTPAA